MTFKESALMECLKMDIEEELSRFCASMWKHMGYVFLSAPELNSSYVQ